MTTEEPQPLSTSGRTPRAFAALSVRGYAPFVLTFMLTMMADNIEHVISYWVIFQKFDSQALGGFAVISHWLPYLLFSVAAGALNDRFDSRRLIQAGGALFALVSIGWGVLIATDTLEMWHAMVLLVLHGCAGVLWSTSSQMLLYDIVGPTSLASAVRLMATARYLGMLLGPWLGSLLMRTLGPTGGIFLNAAIYLPLLLWLVRAPYGRAFRGDAPGPKRAVRGLRDILDTLREVRTIPVLAAMVALAGAASFFVGNSYQAQMPKFADDLGRGDPGAAYSTLLGADAAGALAGGLLLELGKRVGVPRPATAIAFAAAWAVSLASFALTRSFVVAVVCLFAAGFFELAFSSMNQTIVQTAAPNEIRGRVLGLFSMASNGLRTFSGITVGIAGSFLTVHTSLAVAAGRFSITALALLLRVRRRATA
jgi:MFS family permease